MADKLDFHIQISDKKKDKINMTDMRYTFKRFIS